MFSFDPRLPWTVWVTEVDRYARVDAELGVAGELSALIPGDASQESAGSPAMAVFMASLTLIASRPSGRCSSTT